MPELQHLAFSSIPYVAIEWVGMLLTCLLRNRQLCKKVIAIPLLLFWNHIREKSYKIAPKENVVGIWFYR